MLYTFLLQHKNTTCIRQVDADSLREAVTSWIPLLEGVMFGKDEKKGVLDLAEVDNEMKDTRLVPLNNMQNVWCAFIRFSGVDALLNVVLMESNTRNENDFDLV